MLVGRSLSCYIGDDAMTCGKKYLELEEVEEELRVGIAGYSVKYLDKSLDDHVLFWYLRGWNLCVCLGSI